ncbi:hypothetical protein D3C76_1141130 [compost metagenome]
MRLRRCKVARYGLKRWVSTSALLDRSSRLFKRSAVTRRIRSPPSAARLPLRGTGASGSASASTGSITASAITGSGSTLGIATGGALIVGVAAGSSSPAICTRKACTAGSMAASPGVAIRISRSVPCSKASICSARSSNRPSWAPTRQSSMTWATLTPASTPTIRAAPLSE